MWPIPSKVKPIEQLITLKVIRASEGIGGWVMGGLVLLECKELHHKNSILFFWDLPPPVRAIILAVNADIVNVFQSSFVWELV